MRKTLMATLVAILVSGAAIAAPSPQEFSVQMEIGNVQQAKEWLDQGMSPQFHGSRIGTGMHIGAWEGNIQLLELFLQRGGNINALNRNGESPLALAVWKNRDQAVKWLLERGAQVNTPDKTWSPLHYAAFAGHKDLVDVLIDRGANLHARTPNGSTVLMMSLYDGHVGVAEHLLNKGAPVDGVNDWGDGAFEWAMRGGNTKIAEKLGDPEKYKNAMANPQKWNAPFKSRKASPELEQLLRERQHLLDRGAPVQHLQEPIRKAMMAMVTQTQPQNSGVVFEISASRSKPSQQKTQLVPMEKYETPGTRILNEKYTPPAE
jgi:uncharacterized protein